MIVECIKPDAGSLYDYDDERISQVIFWLKENVGQRWIDWNWVKYGHSIRFIHPRGDEVLIFKLKFGI